MCNFQYIDDSILIEKTFQILEAESSEDHIIKEAFDLSSTLGGIGSSIKQFVESQIKGKDTVGISRTVVNFLAPAIFFRLHPILGLLVTAAQLFGFDLYSIYNKIINAIKPSIEEGIPVSADTINSAAKSVMPNISDEVVTASLMPLRELEYKGLIKQAAGNDAWNANPFIPKNSSPLIRMFSFLSLPKRVSLITGILVWFLKTILLSAGLLAVGGATVGALGLANKPNTDLANKSIKPSFETVQQDSTSFGLKPNSTGAGSHVYKSKPGDLWIENLGSNQPHESILQWTLDSYPNLYEYQDIILREPSFWNAVRQVAKHWSPGQLQLDIPDPFKKKDDILSTFINDVYRTVNKYRGQQ